MLSTRLVVRSLQQCPITASIAARTLLPCVVTFPGRLPVAKRFFVSPAHKETENVIILGAAGRDFHDFISYWSTKPYCKVKAFTGTQIPGIENRRFPAELCNNHLNGNRYPDGIQIYPESQLEQLVESTDANKVVMAYSDMPYDSVQTLAARANASGCEFVQLPPRYTMVDSIKPVVAVCASRTGVGKSQTTRYVANYYKSKGLKVAVVRHPMPYDADLMKQRCQRYEKIEDMDKYNCTIEEREEYYNHIKEGNLLFAGVDYEMILREAEKDADIVLWDGGNNDCPFFKPDLQITLVDSLRPSDEEHFYPGETNVRMADIILVAKVRKDKPNEIEKAHEHAKHLQSIIKTNTPIVYGGSVVKPGRDMTTKEAEGIVKGKKVLVIDDGPTLTHGGMPHGVGYILAQNLGAGEIVDPRPYAQGSMKGVFEKFQHLSNALPAMGYGETQLNDLQATIQATPCDAIVIGTPSDMTHLIDLNNKPSVTVEYDLEIVPQHSKQFAEALDSVYERYEAHHPVVA